MMAGGASSNQRPDRLMRTACPSEDSTCNARPAPRPYRDHASCSIADRRRGDLIEIFRNQAKLLFPTRNAIAPKASLRSGAIG